MQAFPREWLAWARPECFAPARCLLGGYIGCLIPGDPLMGGDSMDVDGDVQSLNLAGYLHQDVLTRLMAGLPHC